MAQTLLLVMVILWLAVVVWLRRREGRWGAQAHLGRAAGDRSVGRHTSNPLTSDDVLAGGLLALLTAGFFWRTLSGDVYQPADGGDLLSFLFPTYRFAAGEVSRGVLPLWNPTLYGGAPFLGDIQAGFLYPINLLLFWTRPDFPYTALQWLAAGHLFWAGLGMYVLLRSLHLGEFRLSWPAALFGALAFELSDPLLMHLGNLNLVAVLSWLPWALAAFEQAVRRRSIGWAVAAAALVAVGASAGHAPSSYYVALALAIYALLRGWAAPPGGRRYDWWPLGALAGIGLLAALLAAPLLLPSVELSGQTGRADLSYQEMAQFSLAPTQALGAVAPGFFGRGPALHWSLWDRVETPFAGVAALIFGIGGLLLAPAGLRRRLWPWVGLALFGLVTALGVYTILHGWLTALLPGYSSFRAPARALALWALGLAVLAAVGVELIGRGMAAPAGRRAFDGFLRAGLLLLWPAAALAYLALLLTQESETAFLRASLAALALTLAAGFWLATWAAVAARRAGWLGPGAFSALAVAVLFLDLAANGAYTDISSSDPTVGFRHPEIVEFLRGDGGLYRIDTRTDIEGLWQPNTAALYGLQDVGGIANPLTLRAWEELWEATGGRDTQLYDMLNTKYVIVADGAPLPGGKFELAFDAPGGLAVYRNGDALPRAWLVHEVWYIAESDLERAGFAAVFAETALDPARTVLLHSADNSDGSAPEPTQFGSPAEGESARVTQYGSTALTVEASTAGPAYLVLSEVWYPGWTATVDGTAARVERANGALRAVRLPEAGTHTVALRYQPASWRLGLGLFAAGLALAGGALLWARRRRRGERMAA